MKKANRTNQVLSLPCFSSSLKLYSNEKISKYLKSYKGGLPLAFMGSIALISFFGLIFVYSPNSLRFSSYQKQVLYPITHASIELHSGDDDDKCDLFKGKWVQDISGSLYTTSSCATIPESKNCFKHGRNDTDFVNWRWKPFDCELPKFNPHNFLRIVGGKKLAFVGDSLARNQMESLLCLLSQVETPVDAYNDSEDRFRTWHFPASNFTLMVFWSKFLVFSEEITVNNTSTGNYNLHFDKVNEKWASKLSTFDYVIISDGHWFFRKNYLYNDNKLIGCVYRNEPNVTELGLTYALRMSFRAALKHINKCKEGLVTLVRTFSPSHFENGVWNTGGRCNRMSPHFEENAKELEKASEYELQLREIQMEEMKRARKENEGQQDKKFKALDVTWPMLMRPDGHPNEFWGNKWMKGYNDCTHWCMPGPVDAWNDFLLAVLLKQVT